MKEDFLVSIITVVYNGEQYLQQTIDSVYNQTYKNIEYIVIDGGSKDRTIDILQENSHKISHWISEPDEGLYDAMNKGIKLANGLLIGTINSDDWYELDAVELNVKAYKENPSASIIHSDRYNILPDNTKQLFKFNPSVSKLKYLSMTYSHPSMFVSKNVYDKHSYNTKLKSSSDYQFVLEVFLNDPNAFFYIPKPLVNFRHGGVSGQLGFYQELKEGYLARKYAGLNRYENIMSIILKIVSKPLILIKQKL